MIAGSYSISGAWLTDSSGRLFSSWLTAVILSGLIWVLCAYLVKRRRRPGASAVFMQAVFSLYLLLLTGLYLRGTAAMWRQWALAETPLWVIGLLMTLLTVYGGCLGERAVGRLSLLAVFFLLLTALADLLLLLPDASVSRLTMSDLHPDWFLAGAVALTLLLPLPVVWLSRGDSGYMSRKSLLIGAAVGGGYLLMVILRSLLILGELSLSEPYPILRTLMLVSAGPALSHLEFWGILALSGAVLTAAMAASARLFSLSLWRQKRRLLIVLAAFAWTVSVFLPLPYLR